MRRVSHLQCFLCVWSDSPRNNAARSQMSPFLLLQDGCQLKGQGLIFPRDRSLLLIWRAELHPYHHTPPSQGTPFLAIYPCSCSKIPLDVCQGSTHILLGIALINKGDKAGAQAVQKAASISHFIIPVKISDIF